MESKLLNFQLELLKVRIKFCPVKCIGKYSIHRRLPFQPLFLKTNNNWFRTPSKPSTVYNYNLQYWTFQRYHLIFKIVCGLRTNTWITKYIYSRTQPDLKSESQCPVRHRNVADNQNIASSLKRFNPQRNLFLSVFDVVLTIRFRSMCNIKWQMNSEHTYTLSAGVCALTHTQTHARCVFHTQANWTNASQMKSRREIHTAFVGINETKILFTI